MAERGRENFDDFDNNNQGNDADFDNNTPDFNEPEAPEAPEAPKPSKVSELKEQVSEKMDSAASSLKGMFSNFDGKRALSIALTVLVVLVVAAIVALTLWYIMKKRTLKTTSHLLPESKVPLMGTDYTKLKGADIPRSYNGKRMTISFWVYIHDVDRYKGIYRHILHRGDKSVQSASPLIFLDKNSNRMHIRFEHHDKVTNDLSMSVPFDRSFKGPIVTTDNTSSSVFTGTIDDLDHALTLDLATRGITLDYIPIQRWVHVAIVVNEEVNGGMIYAYLDGEMVKQEISGKAVVFETKVTVTTLDASGDETAAATETTIISVPKKYQDMNLDKPGDVYVGGSSVEDVGPGFSGLVSNIFFANQDLNASDIYKIYEAGPVDNLAAKLGLPAYGVRSPIYRM